MSDKASHLFNCGCCASEKPEAEAAFDNQLGAVCADCMIQIKWSVAWMKRAGLKRPLVKGDINESNVKRFQIGF